MLLREKSGKKVGKKKEVFQSLDFTLNFKYCIELKLKLIWGFKSARFQKS